MANLFDGLYCGDGKEPTGSKNELAKEGRRRALWERGSGPVLSPSPDSLGYLVASRVGLLPFLSLLTRLPCTWHPRPIHLVPGSLGEADLLSEIATPANLGRRGNTCGNHPPPEVRDGGLADERTSGQVE